ncbi:MAG: Fe/S biogenesis protein NfuA [Halomonadaceae bacterium]|nr:MAG: Fe/S biogenesis protein NfuA [Halomonadaceae bacterium]
MHTVNVTESAREYLGQLIAKQDVEDMGVRIFVTQPGTRHAETCLAYCPPHEVVPSDEKLDMGEFPVYLDHNSLVFLEDAIVDFQSDATGGQLTIKAPNAKVPQVSPDAPLAERLSYILAAEINPGLASHGGEVSLVELTEDNVAILRFGGGCQGCSAVSLTLKQGVEKTLIEQIPEITGVRDVTDHSNTENAYYQ